MVLEMSRVSIFNSALVACFCVVIGLSACREDGAETVDNPRPDGFTTPQEIIVKDDDLAYREGDDKPFTGAVVTRDKEWRPRYFGYYFEGKLHGPETRWYSDGKLKRIFDYNHGEKTRHREWFENGLPKLDAMTKDGIAYGRHIKYDETGRERFIGNFGENLQWDGHIRDVGEDGTVLWDADFENGHYIRGIYPESEKQNLIDNGMLNEDGTPTAE